MHLSRSLFLNCNISYNRKLPQTLMFHAREISQLYEGPSKSYVMNGSPCARRGYASLILCIRISHSIICQHMKFQRNRANINIVIGIQSSLSHIHWPLFFRMKRKKTLRSEVLILTKCRLVWRHFALKGMCNKLLNIVHDVWHLNVGLQIWKWHIFGSKDFYLKRRLPSWITKYRLLVWI